MKIRSTTSREKQRNFAPYLFLSPAITFFLVFILLPLLGSFGLSLISWDFFSKPKFVGIANYSKLINDDIMFSAIRNTFLFTFASIITHVGLGLLLAVAVNRKIPRFFAYIIRTTIFFPFLISWSACSLIWNFGLDPSFGAINYYAHKIGLPEATLLSHTWALPTLIVIDLWKTLGFSFIVILAGIQNIPRDITEAAIMDGANGWKLFWGITFPLCSPAIFFVSVTAFIGAFQIFEPMYIMTRGGPDNSTLSIVEYLHMTAFRNFDIGYGAVISVVIFIVVLLATLFQFRISKFWVAE
jgi:ABC-type glycerol-3-phosphate transport system permease component